MDSFFLSFRTNNALRRVVGFFKYRPLAIFSKVVNTKCMQRTFIQFSQRDPLWADVPLGNSSTITLEQAGCYVTSFAILANYYGHAINPAEMNKELKDAKLFEDGLISADNDLSKLFPDIQYVQSYFFPNATLTTPAVPADLNLLKDLLSDEKKTVIVMIDLGRNQVHFTPVVDCDGTTVTIMNVWDGKVEDLKTVYGDPSEVILKYVVYTGTPQSVTMIEVEQNDWVKLLQKSSELDKIGAGLQFSQKDIDSFGFSQLVLDKFKTATSSVSVPPVPDAAPVTNSLPQQPLTEVTPTLAQKILSFFGLKVQW